MKNLLILATLIFSISSCNQITGNGNIVTEKRKTGDFKAITVGSAFEVELKSGPVTEVIVVVLEGLATTRRVEGAPKIRLLFLSV